MKIVIIYIGGNRVTSEHFGSILKSDLFFAQNIEEASVLITKNANIPLMIFFEKVSLDADTKEIAEIKKSYPSSYIVLVAESIEERELLFYQKAGVSDISHPLASEKRVKNAIDFVVRNQALIQSSAAKQQSLKEYKCPPLKRLFDIVFALLSIIILSPVLIITALAIRIESRGPIVYKSKRVGSNYKIFDFYKFRSMYKDADKRLTEFSELNQYDEYPDGDEEQSWYSQEGNTKVVKERHNEKQETLYFSDDEVIPEAEFLKMKNRSDANNFVKYSNDPRITKVGKILRKFSIDELPQLLNILLGDMSVVGNRPLPLYEAEKLTTDQYIDRFMAPSGLTGLWQVEKRGDSGRLSPEERKQLDIYYAKNHSFWMDFKIIFRTFSSFIQKDNV